MAKIDNQTDYTKVIYKLFVHFKFLKINIDMFEERDM